MQQYFIETAEKKAKNFVIAGTDAHHIMKVMRMRIGDNIRLVVNEQELYLCSIVEMNMEEKTVIVEQQQQLKGDVELPVKVTVVLGMLKSDKFDYAVQKMTELGVHQIIPWQAEFSIVKIHANNEIKKINRWQTIAKEAAEQSKRLVIPHITAPQKLSDIIETISDNAKIFVAYENLAELETKKLIFDKNDKEIYVFIGSEGGISPQEIRYLQEQQKHDINFVSLGKRILRAETAAIFAMSLCTGVYEGLI